VRRFWILSLVISLVACNVAAAAHVCDALTGPVDTSVVTAGDTDGAAGDPARAGASGICDFCLYAATLAIGQRPPEALATFSVASMAAVTASAFCNDPLLSRPDEPPR
jgi:hypothetical protein